ncbi:hypothetical protein ABZP36_008625 [Zizania latifolia]
MCRLMGSEQMSQWSSVSSELVARRVGFSAAVCPPGRCSGGRQETVPTPLPCLALPDGTIHGLPETTGHGGERAAVGRFPSCAGYDVSCEGWLVFSNDDACLLVDPFTGDTVALPSIADSTLRFDGVEPVSDERDELRKDWRAPLMVSIRNLVFCSPELVAVKTARGIAQYNQIALCRPGAGRGWTANGPDKCRQWVEDMIFYQGKLYTVANNQDLSVITITEDGDGDGAAQPRVSRVERVVEGSTITTTDWQRQPTSDMFFLVESIHNELLMVRQRAILYTVYELSHSHLRRTPAASAVECVHSGRTEITVFRADLERARWTEVDSIGSEQALFVGGPCSRAVAVGEERNGVRGGRVFFINDERETGSYWYTRQRPCHVGVHDMVDGSVSDAMPGVSWPPYGVKEAAWIFPRI